MRLFQGLRVRLYHYEHMWYEDVCEGRGENFRPAFPRVRCLFNFVLDEIHHRVMRARCKVLGHSFEDADPTNPYQDGVVCKYCEKYYGGFYDMYGMNK